MPIEVVNATYIYMPGTPFETRALDGVSLSIADGEFVGVIGHTGSGKSTFVQHLNGLIRLPSSLKHAKKRKAKKGQPLPPAPVLKVGEFDLSDKKTDFRALRRHVGMVFQYPEYQLFAETVRDDVAFGLKNFSEKKLTEEEIDSAVCAALEVVGLDFDGLKEQSPFELSGGQKRRVAIAGVIVSRPEILILDEPAAGLDPLGKKEILELLHRLHREWCKTVVIVSHDMDEISENCTRAAVFSEGTVKYVLPPKELFRRTEELTALGLDVPLTAKLCAALRARGIDVDCDFTTEDFADKVLAYAASHPKKEGDA